MIKIHPSNIKSISSVILKEVISGSAMTTFGLPPKLSNFASKSPIALETYNLCIYNYIVRKKRIKIFITESFTGYTLNGFLKLIPKSLRPDYLELLF